MIVAFYIVLTVASKAANFGSYLAETDSIFVMKVGIGLIFACILNIFSCFTLLFRPLNEKIENKVCPKVQQFAPAQQIPMQTPATAPIASVRPSVCKSCGYDTVVNPLFCGNCGGKVAEPLQNSQVCKTCGAIVPAAHNYCHNCKTKLK